MTCHTPHRRHVLSLPWPHVAHGPILAFISPLGAGDVSSAIDLRLWAEAVPKSGLSSNGRRISEAVPPKLGIELVKQLW